MSAGAPLVMPTRVLIVGGGGREHALAWKLAGEPGVNEVIVAPGSAGIATVPRVRCLPGVDPLDGASVVVAARSVAAELVVVGPEAPLAAGVADALRDAGFAVFGPSRAAARIESSKAFCHDVAAAAGVPMARAGTFTDAGPAIAFVEELDRSGHRAVVKADGLAAGKGVVVCDTTDEAVDAIRAAIDDGPLVIEERLDGREASAIALCDGERAVALPLARDHKRLLDGDRGPNTGGMGAYSPLPDLPDDRAAALTAQFHVPILRELARRGDPFRGALYAGLILTADGPVLLECNARFGDPETQVILPRIAGSLGPWLLAAARGRLPATATVVPTLPGATAGIVLAAGGYPGTPERGQAIAGLDAATAAGALAFHAGTEQDDDAPGFRTAGGRILTIVASGPDLPTAAAAADRAADLVTFAGRQRRHDIAIEGASVAGSPA